MARTASTPAPRPGPGTPMLGVGIGWRPEIDPTVQRLPGVDFVEVIAEAVCGDHLPAPLASLRARGVPVLPHGVSLSLGGAEPPRWAGLDRLARSVEVLDAPLVSEHIAFVRAGGLEAGHLLPVPRTRDALAVVVANVRTAQAALPAPLAVENVAALLGWPDDELTDGQFLAELVERTEVRLLLDVANLYTNQVNLGLDPLAALTALPLDAVAYVHVAGGVLRDGVWHDPPCPPGARGGARAAGRPVRAHPRPRRHARTRRGLPRRRRAGRRTRRHPPDPPRHGAPLVTGPPPLLAAARDRLARAQADLLAALLAGAPPPPGFDPTRIRIQTDALLAKRRAVVARLRPDLVDLAGTAFRGRFDAYARAHPRPACARDDADAFARTLSTADDAVRPAPGDRIHRHTRISTAARRVADRLGTLRLFVADDVGGGLGAAVPALKARAWRRHRSSQ